MSDFLPTSNETDQRILRLLEDLKVRQLELSLTIEAQKRFVEESFEQQSAEIAALKLATNKSAPRFDQVFAILDSVKYTFISRRDERLTRIIKITSPTSVKYPEHRVADTMTEMKNSGFPIETVRDARSRNVQVPLHIKDGYRIIPPTAELEPYKGSYYVAVSKVAEELGKPLDIVNWAIALRGTKVTTRDGQPHIGLHAFETLKRTLNESLRTQTD